MPTEDNLPPDRATPDANPSPDAPEKRTFLKKSSAILASLQAPAFLRFAAPMGSLAAAAPIAAQAQSVSVPTTYWLFNETSGRVARNTTRTLRADAYGTNSSLWSTNNNKPGAQANGKVRFMADVTNSNIGEILNLFNMNEDDEDTQICVWWTMAHPTSFGGTNPGMIWYWGKHDSANGGWGIGIDPAANFLRLEITHPGTGVRSYPLNSMQPGMTLAVKKGKQNPTFNNISSCCVVIERSKLVPHLVVKSYVHPHEGFIDLQTTQTLRSVPTLNLPQSVAASRLFFLGRANHDNFSTASQLPSKYSLCNWGACRRTTAIDNIGARIAKDLAVTNLSNYYTTPASADDPA